MNNVIKHNFSNNPFGQLGELYDRLQEVTDDYAGEVSTASVIGIIEMLKRDILEREISNEEEI